MSHTFWSSVRLGAAYGLPVQTALAPLAILFGALAIGQGMTPLEATVMSATVFAGAAQFVAIDLMGHAVPIWSIVVSVLAVNFRHLLYSAAITPVIHVLPWRVKVPMFFLLVDPAFAFIQENKHRLDLVAYFSLGVTVTREYGELPPVEAHGSELNQVWTNLIDNASDALDGKGVITLRTYREGENVVVLINLEAGNFAAQDFAENAFVVVIRRAHAGGSFWPRGIFRSG